MEKNVEQRMNEWKENLINGIVEFLKKHLGPIPEQPSLYFDEIETFIEQADHDGVYFIRHFIVGLKPDGIVIARNAEEIEFIEYELKDLSLEGVARITDKISDGDYYFDNDSEDDEDEDDGMDDEF